LKRLGLEDRITAAMPADVMLPAVAQGAVGIEVRIDDVEAGMLIAPLNCETTALAVTAERAFLARLEGSCRTPIAGLARLEEGTVRFKGLVLSPDGSEVLDVERRGSPREAARVGTEAAEDLLRRGADRIMVRER
jgi:hydroxymethylbilane synthase